MAGGKGKKSRNERRKKKKRVVCRMPLMPPPRTQYCARNRVFPFFYFFFFFFFFFFSFFGRRIHLRLCEPPTFLHSIIPLTWGCVVNLIYIIGKKSPPIVFAPTKESAKARHEICFFLFLFYCVFFFFFRQRERRKVPFFDRHDILTDVFSHFLLGSRLRICQVQHSRRSPDGHQQFAREPDHAREY